MSTINFPLALAKELEQDLAKMRNDSGFYGYWIHLKKAIEDTESTLIHEAQITRFLKESDIVKPESSVTPVKEKKLLPIEMAREYVANHKSATPADVKEFLQKQGLTRGTARNASYKVFKKN